MEWGMVGETGGGGRGGASCDAGAICPVKAALRSERKMSLFKLSMCPVVRAASLLRSSLNSYLK